MVSRKWHITDVVLYALRQTKYKYLAPDSSPPARYAKDKQALTQSARWAHLSRKILENYCCLKVSLRWHCARRRQQKSPPQLFGAPCYTESASNRPDQCNHASHHATHAEN
jgi:hypothetical protein